MGVVLHVALSTVGLVTVAVLLAAVAGPGCLADARENGGQRKRDIAPSKLSTRSQRCPSDIYTGH